MDPTEKAIVDAFKEGVPKTKSAVPECSEMLSFLSACAEIRPQIERIRRGQPVRHCGHYISDWSSCIWARSKSENVNNLAKQQEWYYSSYHYKELQAKTVNDIFVYKEKPGWS